MFCKNRGAKIEDGMTFCSMCGTSTAQPNAAPAQPVPVPAPAPTPVYNPGGASGVHQMATNRAWWKMLLLGIITLGIYPIIVQDKMVHELNTAAYAHDGVITLSPTAIAPLTGITLGIYYFYYQHTYMARLKQELQYRGISYGIGPGYFWLLGVVFAFTLVCPCVLLHKICKAHNLINADYNQKGM